MEIKTKFNLQDRVFVMYENKPEIGEIHDIDTHIQVFGKPVIKYGIWLDLKNPGGCPIMLQREKSVPEIRVFSTKAELLDSL